MMTALFLISGLFLLYFGADWLVKGSSNLALRAGISSLVVGLTIVAFGTSAPELVVSMRAGLNGLGNVAVGNVIGSNIFNIAVILGISSAIHPLKVNIQILRIDIPIMIFASLILWFFLRDSGISRIEGIILTTGITLYTTLTIYLGRKIAVKAPNASAYRSIEKTPGVKSSLHVNVLLILLGLSALVLGSRLFVEGATNIARILEISDTVIGLTIVAAGTSLPELATSVLAVIKHEEDIAVGNIIGSNIFNILAILGLCGTFTPLSASGILPVDLAFMTGTALLLLPLTRTGVRIVRTEGIVLLAVYVAYLGYLWPK